MGRSTSQPITASERNQIVARLSDLQAKQEAATEWGAAVGAREEEIRSLESRLLRIDSMTAPPSTETPRNTSSGSWELRFGYTNWEGRNSERRVRPISVRYGQSKWHQRDGWLMLAFDLDKNEEREFSMCDMVMVERSDPIALNGLAQPPRTPLDLSAGELNALATDAFREAAQASTKPAAWFTGNAEDGFDQVAKEFEGTKGTIPLYATDAQTAFNLGFRAAGGGCHLPPDAERLFQSWSAVTTSPGPGAWTPDQFWEYVGAMAGEFEAGQMRDMMAAKGLSITSTSRRTCQDQHRRGYCTESGCPYAVSSTTSGGTAK